MTHKEAMEDARECARYLGRDATVMYLSSDGIPAPIPCKWRVVYTSRIAEDMKAQGWKPYVTFHAVKEV